VEQTMKPRISLLEGNDKNNNVKYQTVKVKQFKTQIMQTKYGIKIYKKENN
jgi:hypothetical protein